MNLFATAMAEASMTAEEAAATAGILVGVGIGAMAMVLVVLFVLQAIADWKIFTKAGEAGWKSLIPFYNFIVEYDLSWNKVMGIVYVVLTICTTLLNPNSQSANWQVILYFVVVIAGFVVHAMQSMKLAKCFGKGTGFGIFLIICGPIARLVLGFGQAQYIGKEDD